ncbi:hypothetical protein PROPHIGD54-2_96 [Mycobacterium phage prophiGD54-2]|uniref:hypothetical protein n=1 Tax=Mycobacteroides abscessus TaxID=36809 RepID=UPI0019D1BF4C|nr:hypothetical protein [Mycobacteroides abscessus]QSM04696.1 hypothetical protein PROPHIGD54-2_96 [Mycobacterium phage prophiGD54-2]QSN19610.1 hypothetical protein I3U41_17025 [Mycobacteroides abscessus subsp. abscessus]
MDVTELAHWRYRVKALPAEIELCTAAHNDALREANRLRLEEAWGTATDVANAGRRAFLTNAMRERLPRNIFDDDVDAIESELSLLKFLYEEAKYMVELGELTRT